MFSRPPHRIEGKEKGGEWKAHCSITYLYGAGSCIVSRKLGTSGISPGRLNQGRPRANRLRSRRLTRSLAPKTHICLPGYIISLPSQLTNVYNAVTCICRLRITGIRPPHVVAYVAQQKADTRVPGNTWWLLSLRCIYVQFFGGDQDLAKAALARTLRRASSLDDGAADLVVMRRDCGPICDR